MRVWDCSPGELAQADLLREVDHVRELWGRVWEHRFSYEASGTTEEVRRFEPRPHLLVARYDYLFQEARARGLPVDQDLVHSTSDGLKHADSSRTVVPEECGDWYALRIMHAWPANPSGVESPWQDRGLDYNVYRSREEAAA